MRLGLKRGTVALYPHEAAWEREAERTVSELRGILGSAATDYRHVGSTAIRSIKAKPIVDIAVSVNDFADILAKEDALREHGFYYRPGAFDETQLFFACGSFYDGTGELQTHFIHVVKKDGPQWRDYLNFGDYMNAFPAAARRYEALKERLAAANPEDPGRERYLAGKHDFILDILRRATVWSFLGKNIRMKIDRPVGYVHAKGGYTLVYPLNYGYIPGVPGGDGEDLDVYLIGVTEPVSQADCRVVGVVHRKNDAEDKLIAAPEGTDFTKEEMENAVRFQEQWYDSRIIPLRDAARFDELYGE
ncbi:MAG: GrpB family protein [Clostridia bacterium]|nr:GrpB family protein [Clostridia bacterium]